MAGVPSRTNFRHRVALVWIILLANALVGWSGASEVRSIQERLTSTSIERIRLDEASLGTALDFLGERLGGVSFVLLASAEDENLGATPVTLALRSVPAATALDYLCRLANCAYRVEAHAIVVGSPQALRAVETLRATRPKPASGSRELAKLRATRLERITFADAELRTALQFLSQQVQASTGKAPANFVILEDRIDPKAAPVGRRLVTLDLDGVPALTALGYLTESSGLSYRVDGRAIVIGTPEMLALRPAHRVASQSALYRRLSSIQVEKVSLQDVGLEDALVAVRYYSRQGRDESSAINLVDAVPDEQKAGLGESPVDLTLADVLLVDLIGYIAEQTGTRLRSERLALLLEPDPVTRERAQKYAEANPPTGGAGADSPTGASAAEAPRFD